MRRIIILTLPLLLACSRELDVHQDYGNETINGFEVEWDGSTSSLQKEIITGILNDMAHVQGGYFMMGATDEQTRCNLVRNNEFPVHLVKLDDYYICRHEMSYDKIESLCSRRFIIKLSWDEANEIVSLIRYLTGLNVDMPTEAQWEYAARGGSLSGGYLYPGSNTLSDIWSQEEDSLSVIPNELGIFNMGDGLYEWCKDYYYEYDDAVVEVNPCHCSCWNLHVLRGGGCRSNADASEFSDYNRKTYDLYHSSSHISCRSGSSVELSASIRLAINE